MKVKRLIFLLVCLGSCFCSCRQSKDQEYTVKAQSIADSDPKQALAMLDSVKEPEQMSREDYMSYIVTRTQAKYKDYQDITLDSAIVKAAAYFDSSRNPDRAALANYYAACYYDDKSMLDSSMLYYTKTIKYAEQAQDPLLLGKSYHSIAVLYLDDNNEDSAHTYYMKALDNYQKIDKPSPEITVYILEVIWRTSIGFNALKQYDTSLKYAQNGLKLAQETNNIKYISMLHNQHGVIFQETKKYNEARESLFKSLINSSSTDSLRIYLNLSETYRLKGQKDSTAYFLNIAEKRLPLLHSQDIETQASAYRLLSMYYDYMSNLKEALKYSELEKEAKNKMALQRGSSNLVKVANEYQDLLRENRLKEKQARSRLLWAGALLLVVVAGGLTIFFIIKTIKLKNKKEKERSDMLQKQYNKKVDSINHLQSVYRNLAVEWTAIDSEVQKLAREYGVKQEPALYSRMQALIADIRNNTDAQFTGWVKELLKEDGYRGTIVGFGHKEYLLMGFCYCKCPDKDMTKLLALPKSKIEQKKLKIKEKLLKRMVPEERVNELLFY